MKVTCYCRAAEVMQIESTLAITNASINVMPERGGLRDRVGTLIRNRNLESNSLTFGIRFQFKVPHLGEGFELNISHQTENF